MTRRERIRTILKLALPIIGGMASQNVLNLIDVGMVGQLGSPALAATTYGGMVTWLAGAFFLALGSGVQAITARRMGEGNPRGAVMALHAALVIAAVVVLPYSLLLATQAEPIFGLLSSDPAVLEHGVPYIRIRFLAVALVTMNFSFRGYWNGLSMSTVYLRTILTIHVSNVILNWLLIYGNLGFPRLEVRGAAMASAIAIAIGTGTYIFLATKHTREHGFLDLACRAPGVLANVLRLSVPAGIQGLFFSAGFLAFVRITGALGTKEVAATGALINLAMLCVLPALGFGLAAATLVGKSLGEGDKAEAFRWGWMTVKLAVGTLTVIGLTLTVAPAVWLDILMNDPAAEAMAVVPLILVGLSQPVDAVGLVLSQSLIGAGDVRRVSIATLSLQWGLFLPSCLVAVFFFDPTLLDLFLMFGAWRGLQAIMMAIIFRSGKWTTVRV